MFEPPMERCPVCGDYVTLVQAQEECANRQQCGQMQNCPLSKVFAANDFYRPGNPDAARPALT